MRKNMLFGFIIILLGFTAYYTVKFFNVEGSYSVTEFTLSLASLIITTILTYYLVIINDKLYKKENAERLDTLRKSAYILKTELSQIYQVFASILMSKNDSKFTTRIEITDDWKQRVALFSGYLPKPCLDNLFSLFLFVELINSTESGKHINIHMFNEFIEINNIEYYDSKNDWLLLANIQSRLVFVFLNKVIDGEIEKVNERYKHQNSIYLISHDGVNGTLKDMNSQDVQITTSYHNNRIETQIVKIAETIIRDVTYGETGQATGRDKYTVDKKKKYSRLYRREWDGRITVNFGPSPTDEKYQYQGYITKNKLDGVGIINKNDSLYKKGSFIEGKLYSGEMYNIEINRKYKEKMHQQNYDAEQYFSSDEYIEKEIEAQEAMHEAWLEDEKHYTSIRADYEVVDGKKTLKNTKEIIVLKMDSDDYI